MRGYDTGEKARIYAAAGVRDYWVVDIPGRRLHVFRDPSPHGFRTHETFAGDARVVPLLLSGTALVLSEMFAALEGDDLDDESDTESAR
jgi:Uma2 family endonuclease